MSCSRTTNAVTSVKFEPAASRSRVKHSTTEPFGELCPFVHKILKGNKILANIKGHNSGTNVQKKDM